MDKPNAINPLAKFLILIVLSVMVFQISDPAYMVLFVAVVIVAKVLTDARSTLTKGVMWFAFAIFLAQVIFNHSGDIAITILFLDVNWGGIVTGVLIAGRFLALITMSWIFVATTRASDFSSALISSGMPYRFAYLPALAMRFVPVFQVELSAVRDAQVTRGLRLDKSIKGIVRAARYTTMPMLISAMSKVNTLAASMTGRGFGAYPKRTLLKPLRMTMWDILLVISSIALAVAIIYFSRCYEIDSLVHI